MPTRPPRTGGAADPVSNPAQISRPNRRRLCRRSRPATPRRATVRPYLLEPSLQTHALYLIGFDEERGAIRTFKIERIGAAALTPRTFEPPDPAATTSALRAAWDIIADQPPVDVELRFVPKVAGRVLEATWHPTQTVATEPAAEASSADGAEAAAPKRRATRNKADTST